MIIKVLSDLIEGFNFCGDIEKDSYNLLIKYNCSKTAEHSLRVARKAKSLAKIYEVDENLAQISGYLHDISGIIPNKNKLDVAKALGIEILSEEEKFPMILHQKLSKIIAREIFNIEDSLVLDAISCHTTLKANATSLDMILFIADKIEWDQQDLPPYIVELEEALNTSLELGTYIYIKYLWDDRENLKVIHPWLVEAYKDLSEKLNKS